MAPLGAFAGGARRLMFWLSPVALLLTGLALLGIGACSRQARRRALLRVAGIAATATGLLGMTPLVGNALVARIEAQAAQASGACPHAEAVVLLSAGLARAPRDAGDFAALTSRSLERIAGYLARPGEQRLLVVAGGGPHPVKESEVIGALLERLGVPAARIARETSSRTTWENATAVRALQPALRRIALATGALHLPRARVAFEAAGFEVCGWALHREAQPVALPGALWPGATALRKTEAGLHEWVGGLYYRWLAARNGAESTSS